MAADRAAENTIFILHADNIRLTDIEELRRHAVIAQFILVDLKANFFWSSRLPLSFFPLSAIVTSFHFVKCFIQ